MFFYPYFAIFSLLSSYFSQIFWPASTSKVEECQMAGKDPTVRTLTLLNSWYVMARSFIPLFHSESSSIFDSTPICLLLGEVIIQWAVFTCIILPTITAIN